MNFNSVAICNSAVNEFWKLLTEQRIKLVLNPFNLMGVSPNLEDYSRIKVFLHHLDFMSMISFNFGVHAGS